MKELSVVQMGKLWGGQTIECTLAQIATTGSIWGWLTVATAAVVAPELVIGAGIALAGAGVANGYYCH